MPGRKKKAVQTESCLCENMSFMAAESYKMLRTKLSLIVPRDDRKTECRVIGITSSLRGEGKTTTAINLAYTFAEDGKRTLLIEADMRIPTIHRRLDLHSTPGLSEILSSESGKVPLQTYGVSREGAEKISFRVIVAGEAPPLPSELLGSGNMRALLEKCRERFDYIIVDLPPVTVVTDAITISSLLDGMLLVVRENYCDRNSLADTVNQFEIAHVPLLGVVMNESAGVTPGAGNSRRYYSGKRYYSGEYREKT